MQLPVFISTGQSNNPRKRELEQQLAERLDAYPGLDVTLVANLYDLTPAGPALSAMDGVDGDMLVFSWLYPRSAHWILDRHGIRGQVGEVELELAGDDQEDDPVDESAEDDTFRVLDDRPLPQRVIYNISLKASDTVEDFAAEVQRIGYESLQRWIQGAPDPDQLARFEQPADTNIESNSLSLNTLEADAARRWYPVIDFSRCTNCMECIDFCLFGVYGVDRAETILVEQPDNCRKGCPACSRVCPENAIVFPQHKSPAIAGAAVEVGGLKIDLSLLFGKPDAAQLAARERDEQLVLAGRDPLAGPNAPLEKRQADKPSGPADELDNLLDQLDELA